MTFYGLSGFVKETSIGYVINFFCILHARYMSHLYQKADICIIIPFITKSFVVLSRHLSLAYMNLPSKCNKMVPKKFFKHLMVINNLTMYATFPIRSTWFNNLGKKFYLLAERYVCFLLLSNFLDKADCISFGLTWRRP